jgi:hypothetical protein
MSKAGKSEAATALRFRTCQRREKVRKQRRYGSADVKGAKKGGSDSTMVQGISYVGKGGAATALRFRTCQRWEKVRH